MPSRTKGLLALTLAILILGLVSAGSCGGSRAPEKADQKAANQAGVAPEMADRAASSQAPDPNILDRKIIKNAEFSLTVSDLFEAVKAVESATEAARGIVAESSVSGSVKGRRRGTVIIRVPSTSFGSLMVRLQEIGQPTSQRIYTQDVSGEYVDLEARILSAKEHEQRLRVILGRASTVDELLKLESELARVRGEIESLTGRFNLLKDRVDFSTIRLNLVEVEVLSSDRPPTGIVGRALEAFIGAIASIWRAGGELVVALAAALPGLILLAALVWAGWAVYRKFRPFKEKQDQFTP